MALGVLVKAVEYGVGVALGVLVGIGWVLAPVTPQALSPATVNPTAIQRHRPRSNPQTNRKVCMG